MIEHGIYYIALYILYMLYTIPIFATYPSSYHACYITFENTMYHFPNGSDSTPGRVQKAWPPCSGLGEPVIE